MKLFGALLLICLVAGAYHARPAAVQDAALKDTTNSRYKVGQRWSYKTRPGEEASYFVVVKVESHPKLGNIIHVAVRNLRMKNPRSPDGISDKANHMPFAERGIEKSAVKLLKEGEKLPGYAEGYKLWREAFDAGSAGVYTITLAEAVEVMEMSLNR